MIVAIKVILLMMTDDDGDVADYKTNKNYVSILVLIRYGFIQLTYQFWLWRKPYAFLLLFPLLWRFPTASRRRGWNENFVHE